jgi:TPR repeat protein
MGAIMTGRPERSAPPPSTDDRRFAAVDLQSPGEMAEPRSAQAGRRYAEATSAAGRGDYASAIRLWRRFANAGDGMSQYNLGQMYEVGQGVTRDLAEAAEWYRRAAESGVPPARLSLGVAYALGRGVPQDLLQAHKWLSLAAAAYAADEDRSRAVKARDLVATRMTFHEIAEAQRLAREWEQQRGR